MKIEIGKKYKVRCGKVGIAAAYKLAPNCFRIGSLCTVHANGLNCFGFEDYDVVEYLEDGWSDWATITPREYFPNLVKGKDYECSYVGGVFKYRVKDREPEVKEVVSYFYLQGITKPEITSGFTRLPEDTHKITIKIIDGVIQPQALIEAL